MEILTTQAEKIMRAKKISRSMYWKDSIIEKGETREFPYTDEGRQEFYEMGGFQDWEPLGIPEAGEYIVVVHLDEKKSKQGKLFPYEPFDEIELSRERAITLMKQGGKVQPVSPEVPDVGFFCSYRYQLPRSKPGMALPREDQMKERRRQELLERKRKTGISKTARNRSCAWFYKGLAEMNITSSPTLSYALAGCETSFPEGEILTCRRKHQPFIFERLLNAYD